MADGRGRGRTAYGDGRRRSFFPSVTPLARRTSLQELVNIPWSGEWNVGRSVVGNNVALGLPDLELGFSSSMVIHFSSKIEMASVVVESVANKAMNLCQNTVLYGN